MFKVEANLVSAFLFYLLLQLILAIKLPIRRISYFFDEINTFIFLFK